MRAANNMKKMQNIIFMIFRRKTRLANFDTYLVASVRNDDKTRSVYLGRD